MLRNSRFTKAVLVAAAVSACEDDCKGPESVTPPPFTPPAEYVTAVSPSMLTLEVGQSGLVTAQTDDGLRPSILTGVPGDANIATAIRQGDFGVLVTGVSVGQTDIAVGAFGNSATRPAPRVQVTVIAPAVSLEIAPAEALLAIGQTQVFTCVATSLRTGQVLPGEPVTWRSSDNGIVMVDANGMARGVGIGFADIICESRSGATASARVGVLAPLLIMMDPPTVQLSPGQTTSLRCIVTEQSGTVVNGLPLMWTSSDESVATVDQNGNVAAIADGTATINCRLDTGESATGTVTVATQTSMVPTAAQLPGNYSLNGSVQSNTCPAGLFPATITNPGTIAVQVVGTGQNPPVSIGSTTTVTGIFNAMTGAFSGSGSTTVPFNGVSYNLVEMINGVWSIRTTAMAGEFDVFLNGTVSFTATPSGGTSCNIVYDATYLRRIVS